MNQHLLNQSRSWSHQRCAIITLTRLVKDTRNDMILSVVLFSRGIKAFLPTHTAGQWYFLGLLPTNGYGIVKIPALALFRWSQLERWCKWWWNIVCYQKWVIVPLAQVSQPPARCCTSSAGEHHCLGCFPTLSNLLIRLLIAKKLCQLDGRKQILAMAMIRIKDLHQELQRGTHVFSPPIVICMFRVAGADCKLKCEGKMSEEINTQGEQECDYARVCKACFDCGL